MAMTVEIRLSVMRSHLVSSKTDIACLGVTNMFLDEGQEILISKEPGPVLPKKGDKGRSVGKSTI